LRHLSRHRALRVIGWITAYALALQTMLLGLGAVPSLAAGATGSLTIQLCLTGGDGADAGEPSQHLAAQHCLGCFATTAALPAPAPDVLPVAYPAAPVVAASVYQAPPILATGGRPGLPRAPPFLV
jgi:hypothetical protein